MQSLADLLAEEVVVDHSSGHLVAVVVADTVQSAVVVHTEFLVVEVGTDYSAVAEGIAQVEPDGWVMSGWVIQISNLA